jgi:hypothetical protein
MSEVAGAHGSSRRTGHSSRRSCAQPMACSRMILEPRARRHGAYGTEPAIAGAVKRRPQRRRRSGCNRERQPRLPTRPPPPTWPSSPKPIPAGVTQKPNAAGSASGNRNLQLRAPCVVAGDCHQRRGFRQCVNASRHRRGDSFSFEPPDDVLLAGAKTVGSIRRGAVSVVGLLVQLGAAPAGVRRTVAAHPRRRARTPRTLPRESARRPEQFLEVVVQAARAGMPQLVHSGAASYPEAADAPTAISDRERADRADPPTCGAACLR